MDMKHLGNLFGECITNLRFTTHCFFSTKKKACQEKTYRTEVILKIKIFNFYLQNNFGLKKILSKGAF